MLATSNHFCPHTANVATTYSSNFAHWHHLYTSKMLHMVGCLWNTKCEGWAGRTVDNISPSHNSMKYWGMGDEGGLVGILVHWTLRRPSHNCENCSGEGGPGGTDGRNSRPWDSQEARAPPAHPCNPKIEKLRGGWNNFFMSLAQLKKTVEKFVSH